jgi:hypothetical protein
MASFKGSGVYTTLTDSSFSAATVAAAVTGIFPMLTKKGGTFTTVTAANFQDKVGYDLAYNPGYLGLKTALQNVASITVMRLNKNATVQNLILFQSGRYSFYTGILDPTTIGTAVLAVTDGPYTTLTTVTRPQIPYITVNTLKIYDVSVPATPVLVAHDTGAGAIVADAGSGVTGTVAYTGSPTFTLNYTGTKTLSATYTPAEVVAVAIPGSSAGSWGPIFATVSQALKTVNAATAASVPLGEAVVSSSTKIYSAGVLVAHDNAGTLVADNTSGVAGTVNSSTGVITFSVQPTTSLLSVAYTPASSTNYTLAVYQASGVSAYTPLESQDFSTVLTDSNALGKLIWSNITPILVSGFTSAKTFGSAASPLPLLGGSDGALMLASDINSALLDSRSETFIIMNGITSSAYANVFLNYADIKQRFRVLVDAPAFSTYDATAGWKVANLKATNRGALYAVPDYVASDIGPLPLWPSVKVFMAYANMYSKAGVLKYPVAGYQFGATTATSLLTTDFSLHEAELKLNKVNYVKIGSQGPVIWEERSLYGLESDLSYNYVTFILDDLSASLKSFMSNYTFRLITPDDMQRIQVGLSAIVNANITARFLWTGKVEVPSWASILASGVRQATIPVTVQVAQDGEEWTVNVILSNLAVS